MGCGKSYLSSRLAQELGYELKDSDTMIEESEKISIKEIFQKHGEEYFRSLESKAAEKIKTLSSSVIATGGGFPIYYKDIKSLGMVVYMDISFEDILKRMTPQDVAKRPLFRDIDRARSLYNDRIDIYKDRSHYQVDATMSVDDMINFIKDKLK